MKIIIGDKSYEYDHDKLLNSEAIAIEQELGILPGSYASLLKQGSPSMITAIVWIARRRAGETDLEYAEVAFDFADMDLEDTEQAPKESAAESS